jgi:hypothetical protein
MHQFITRPRNDNIMTLSVDEFDATAVIDVTASLKTEYKATGNTFCLVWTPESQRRVSTVSNRIRTQSEIWVFAPSYADTLAVA